MAVLIDPIPESKAELARTAIAEILQDEINKQNALQPTVRAFQNVSVEEERATPSNLSELNGGILVSVRLIDTDGIVQSAANQMATTTFFIDIFFSDRATVSGEMGDKRASKKGMRLATAITAILNAPHYKKLEIPEGIGHSRIKRIQVTEIENNMDTESASMIRITHEVKATDVYEWELTRQLALSITTFKPTDDKEITVETDTNP